MMKDNFPVGGFDPLEAPGDKRYVSRLTRETLARRAETMPWGTPDEVTERIIAEAEAMYRDVLAEAPGHAAALRLLGMRRSPRVKPA